MKYEDTTFFAILRKYKLMKLITSVDFLLALALTIIFTYISYQSGLVISLLKVVAPIYATIASGMIAIVIASLAILVSMSDNDFVSLLRENKIYDNLLFIFWYSSILAGVGISVDIISSIFVNVSSNFIESVLLFFLSTFFTSYAVFAVLLTIGTIMRYGLYRAEFIKGQSAKKDDERAIPKSITIFPRHQRFLDDRSINLSKFVQKKIDEEIDATNWKEPEE
jgi:hypothetical protein